MKYGYAVLGIGFFIIIGALVYLTQSKTEPMMQLTSPAFTDGQPIPTLYTCDGSRTLSPELGIRGVPDGATSLVLIVHDPDVPKVLRPDGVFDHWVMYGIDPKTTTIAEGGTPGAQGENGRGEASYTGPCPPPEYEPTKHRYVFTLYATNLGALNFIKAPTKADLLAAIEGHVLETAVLTGTYDRKKQP